MQFDLKFDTLRTWLFSKFGDNYISYFFVILIFIFILIYYLGDIISKFNEFINFFIKIYNKIKTRKQISTNRDNSKIVEQQLIKETVTKKNIENDISNNQKNNLSFEEIKLITKILFIDDDKEFNIVKIIKNNGWKNTKLLNVVNNFDDKKIIEASILFIDKNGVAKNLFPNDDGLGLANAIIDKYPDKKVIIYSAEKEGKNTLHPVLKKSYQLIQKNAEPYEFLNIIDNIVKENYGK